MVPHFSHEHKYQICLQKLGLVLCNDLWYYMDMIEQCRVDGCDRELRANGLCVAHDFRVKRHGDVGGAAIRTKTPKYVGCQVRACDRDHYALGFCRKHYANKHRCGDPGGVLERRRLTEKTRRQVLRMKKEGQSYREIGDLFGFSRQRAQQLIAPTEEERKKVMEKYNGECFFCSAQRCGNGHRLHLHHIYREESDTMTMVPLCDSCHLKIEAITAVY